MILFAFVSFEGTSVWQSILGDDYRRIAKLAVKEFIELVGYLLWLVKKIEYAFQARAIERQPPRSAAVRDKRRIGTE